MKHYDTSVYFQKFLEKCLPNKQKIVSTILLGALVFCVSAHSTATFATPINCLNRAVSNTIDIKNSLEYSIALNDGNTIHFFAGDPSQYSWQECSDGTAEFSATNLKSTTLADEDIDVYFIFSGLSTDKSYLNKAEGEKPFQNLKFYTQTNGTIHSKLHGTFSVERKGAALLIGQALELSSHNLGVEGLFSSFEGDGFWQGGSINILLSDEDFISDGLINSLVLKTEAAQKDILLLDGGKYHSNELPQILGIQAHTSGNIEKLRFTLTGGVNDVFTDKSSSFIYQRSEVLQLPPGFYTLSVQALNSWEAHTVICDEKTISFSILEENKQPEFSNCKLKNPIEGKRTALINILPDQILKTLMFCAYF